MQRGRIIESEIIKSDGEGYRERGEVYKQRERERATREERGWSDAEDSREAHGEIMLVERERIMGLFHTRIGLDSV